MFIEDGSNQAYGNRTGNGKVYAWGWIDLDIPKNDPWTKGELVKVLHRLTHNEASLDATRGSYTCKICDTKLGSRSIGFRYNGLLYLAPSGVEHYITKHKYYPPEEVGYAIMKGKPYNSH